MISGRRWFVLEYQGDVLEYQGDVHDDVNARNVLEMYSYSRRFTQGMYSSWNFGSFSMDIGYVPHADMQAGCPLCSFITFFHETCLESSVIYKK